MDWFRRARAGSPSPRAPQGPPAAPAPPAQDRVDPGDTPEALLRLCAQTDDYVDRTPAGCRRPWSWTCARPPTCSGRWWRRRRCAARRPHAHPVPRAARGLPADRAHPVPRPRPGATRTPPVPARPPPRTPAPAGGGLAARPSRRSPRSARRTWTPEHAGPVPDPSSPPPTWRCRRPMRRGTNIALGEIPGLTSVVVAVRLATSEEVFARSLVVAAVLCDDAGTALSDEHFVFFDQLVAAEASVVRLDVRSAAPGSRSRSRSTSTGSRPRSRASCSSPTSTAAPRSGAPCRSCGRPRCGCCPRPTTPSGPLREPGPGLRLPNRRRALRVYRHHGDWKFKVVGRATTTASSAWRPTTA